MITEAWAFLVSRNRYLDYTTIVAPDFMCQAKATKLLANAAIGELTGFDRVLYREIHQSHLGDLTLIFRILKATATLLEPEAEEAVLKDAFGREIHLIEGIVLRGIEPIQITLEDLEKAHQQAKQAYRQFWNCLEPRAASCSHSFMLQNPNNQAWLKVKRLAPFVVPPKLLPPEPAETVPPIERIPHKKQNRLYWLLILLILLFILSGVTSWTQNILRAASWTQNNPTIAAETLLATAHLADHYPPLKELRMQPTTDDQVKITYVLSSSTKDSSLACLIVQHDWNGWKVNKEKSGHELYNAEDPKCFKKSCPAPCV